MLVPVSVVEGGGSGSLGAAGMSPPLLVCSYTGLYLPAPGFAFAWDRSTVMEGLWIKLFGPPGFRESCLLNLD